MRVDEYLSQEGISKAGLAERLGISRAAISQWDEIPEKWMKALAGEIEERVYLPDGNEADASVPSVGVASRQWKVVGDKLHWQGGVFGHGSEWDYNYSPAKIRYIRGLLKQMGSVQAVYDWIQPVQFDRGFIEAVHKDVVCPIVVDMVFTKVGNVPIPKRVYPFGDKS